MTEPLDRLRRYGDHSSGFLTLNEQMEHYVDPEIDGFIAYRRAGGRHVIQLCGPVGLSAGREALLRSFLAWTASERRRVTAVQLRRPEAELYAAHGFTVNQFGSSYSLALERFTLAGTRFRRVRQKVQRARRAGVSIQEWDRPERQEPAAEERLAEIDRLWLRSKGARAKELAFMVGERGGPVAGLRRLFVASEGGRPVAYATCSPAFGSLPGWLYDLTRRRPDAPIGTMELLFVTAVERLREGGSAWLHLGLTPMARLDRRHELPGSSSRVGSWLLDLLAQHGDAIYPARSQEQFKLKWAPHAIEPEYIAFAPRVNLGAIWRLLRLTRAV